MVIETAPGPDGKLRCAWGVSAPDYVAYHDREWGFPVRDDRRLFEKLCLEGFQAGLSWLTILRKREGFRAAFANFEPAAVAKLGARDVTRLVTDAAIIRHRGKIESTINNAKRALEVIAEHGSMADFVWSYEPKRGEDGKEVGAKLAKDLRKRGWTFVGPTTVYAFMQAMGLVNDHAQRCSIRRLAQAARKS